jgi:hypothetical protein
VLKHASRSRHIDLDRPPAAAGGLRSQVPDLVHGPRELLDCRQLQQAGRRERTRSFDRRSKAGIDLAASALSHWAVRASTDEQRTGYALGVAIVQTAQRRSHDVGWRETHLYTRLSPVSLNSRLYTPSTLVSRAGTPLHTYTRARNKCRRQKKNKLLKNKHYPRIAHGHAHAATSGGAAAHGAPRAPRDSAHTHSTLRSARMCTPPLATV